MNRFRKITYAITPWLIYFLFADYDNIKLHIAIYAALVSAVILNYRSIFRLNIFNTSNLLFFLAMMITLTLDHHGWLLRRANLIAQLYLFLLCTISLLVRRPISIEYTKLYTARDLWHAPLFLRINQFLTLCWAGILLVLILLHSLSLYLYNEPVWFNDLSPTALVIITIAFTFWFPDWYERKIIGKWGVINAPNISELRIAQNNLANISYRTLGSGKHTLFLLPGLYMSMYDWEPELITKLAKHFEVVLLDYPDIGHSKLCQGEFTLPNITNALKEFMVSYTQNNFAVLGYSMGGWFAQELALQLPRKISYLVLIATDAGSSRITQPDLALKNTLKQISITAKRNAEQVGSLLFTSSHLAEYTAHLQTVYNANQQPISNTIAQLENQLADQWYAGEGCYQHLWQIEAKTLVVTGTEDVLVNRQNAVLLANGIRDAKLLEIANAGHGVIYQSPVRIADACIQLTQ